jgi:hypothetical protein
MVPDGALATAGGVLAAEVPVAGALAAGALGAGALAAGALGAGALAAGAAWGAAVVAFAAVWLAGADGLVASVALVTWPWTAWVVFCATSLTAEVADEAPACSAWVVPDAVLATAAGALGAGTLAAGVLAAGVLAV